jgi:hypothetical protein
MSEASIYEGSKTFVPVVNAASNILSERFNVLADGETVFNLTRFTYAPDTGTLFVFINGVLQFSVVDYVETDSDTFTLNVGLNSGDTVTAIAFGINGTASVNLNSYALLADLANKTDTTKNTNLLGWFLGAAGSAGATLSQLLEDWYLPNVLSFMLPADRIKVLSRVPDVDTTYAFVAAYNYCVLKRKTKCRVPAGCYLWDSAATFSSGTVLFEGVGSSITPDHTNSSGTWIVIGNSAITPVTFSGTSVLGSGFCNMAVSQIHPEPSAIFPVAWAPTVYPPIFNCQSIAGDMYFDDLYTPAVYKLVDSFWSARLNMRRWRGQSFLYTVKIEGAYDCCHLDDWHDWPYWRVNNNVMTWTQANGTTIEMGRCDTPFVDNIFSFAKKATIHTYNSGVGPGGVGANPAGAPSLVNFGNIVADASLYGAVWIESDNFTGHISNWVTQGEKIPQGTGVPATGGYGLKVSGTNHHFSIGKISCERYNNECIRLEATNSRINIGDAALTFFNYNLIGSGGTAPAVKVVSVTSNIEFTGYPYLLGYDAAPLTNDGIGVVTGMQVNEAANAKNFLRGESAVSGNPARLFSFGGDTNIGLDLMSKGPTGRARIGGDGVPVIQTDRTGTANSPLLVRNGTNTTQIIVESAGNCDLELIPANAGLVKINAPLTLAAIPQTGYILVKVAGGGTVKLLTGT